jgi:hypothetical protein
VDRSRHLPVRESGGRFATRDPWIVKTSPKYYARYARCTYLLSVPLIDSTPSIAKGMNSHDSPAKLDQPTRPSSDHHLELEELSNKRDGLLSRDDEHDSFLPENEAKVTGMAWLSSGHLHNKQAFFWMAVNIVATVLIVSHTHLLESWNTAHDSYIGVYQ